MWLVRSEREEHDGLRRSIALRIATPTYMDSGTARHAPTDIPERGAASTRGSRFESECSPIST